MDKLEHLVVGAQCLSFSQASQQLNLSQPALSKSVAESERRWGIKIFDRGRGGTTVTAAGKSVILEAERLLQHARTLERSFELFARGDIGRVTFAMAPIVASLALGPLTIAMLNDHPLIELVPLVASPKDAISALRANHLDIALLPVPLNDVMDEGLEVERLFGLQVQAFVRQEHPLTDPSASPNDIWKFKVAVGAAIQLPAVNMGVLVIPNFDILREVTLNSDVVCFSSGVLWRSEISRGDLVAIGNVDHNFGTAIVRRRDTASPAAQAFIDQTRIFARQFQARDQRETQFVS